MDSGSIAMKLGLFVFMILFACSSDQHSLPPYHKVIGPEGGTLVGPSGSGLVIPKYAVSKKTEFFIQEKPDHYPDIGESIIPVGDVFKFGPNDVTLNHNATLILPFDSAMVPSGYKISDVKVFLLNELGEWSELPTSPVSIDSDNVRGGSQRLSYAVAGLSAKKETRYGY